MDAHFTYEYVRLHPSKQRIKYCCERVSVRKVHFQLVCVNRVHRNMLNMDLVVLVQKSRSTFEIRTDFYLRKIILGKKIATRVPSIQTEYICIFNVPLGSLTFSNQRFASKNKFFTFAITYRSYQGK